MILLETQSVTFVAYTLLDLQQTTIQITSNFRFVRNDNGTLVSYDHLPHHVMAVLWESRGFNPEKHAELLKDSDFKTLQNCIVLTLEQGTTKSGALAYLRTTIKNALHDAINLNHRDGSLVTCPHTNTTRRRRSTTSLDYTSNDNLSLANIITTSPTSIDTYAETRETIDLADFFTALPHLIAANLKVMNNTSVIPSLSSANLVQSLMYQIGESYSKYNVEVPILTEALPRCWEKSNLPKTGLSIWNNQLHQMIQDLKDANANHPKIIKNTMLMALNPTVPTDDLFATDTPRESVRKKTNHGLSALQLMSLLVFLSFSPKGGFKSNYLKIVHNFLDPALQVYSSKRKNVTFEHLFESISNSVNENQRINRKMLRTWLAGIIYDQPLENLSLQKQNKLRHLIRLAAEVAADIRPHLPNSLTFG